MKILTKNANITTLQIFIFGIGTVALTVAVTLYTLMAISDGAELANNASYQSGSPTVTLVGNTTGDLYYDNEETKLKYWDGSAWTGVGA